MEQTEPSPTRRGGRPSAERAAQIGDQILDAATALFFAHGYGATSIEAVARRARVSKRTFYSRFRDKAALFGAVVTRLVARLRPANEAQLFRPGPLEDVLHRLALVILQAVLTPEALALHRLVVGEATRFPELAAVLDASGSRREAITRIAALLAHDATAKGVAAENPEVAAEHFLHLIVAAPQRRALFLADPMTPAAREAWARDAVRLFLHGWPGQA